MKAKLSKNREEYILWLDKGTYWEVIGHSFEAGKYKLSKQNCDDIFGVIDVEKIADRHTFGQRNHEWKAYVEGFNKAMELMKDKLTWFKQPTEIDVVIEIEDDFNQCDGCKSGHDVNDFGMHVYPDLTKAYMVCQKAKYKKPKLDSNGCLILKKI
jgi:hypothetical protein